MQTGDVKDAVLRLGGSTALDRERGLTVLRKLLAAADTPAAFSPTLEEIVDVMLASARWEDQLGALTATTAALEACGSINLALRMLEPVLAKLEAEEPRVRLAVGDCLLAMASQLGPLVWERSGTAILASIRRCWDRDALAAPHSSNTDLPDSPDQEEEGPGFVGDLLHTSYRAQQPGTGEMRHGTEGWMCLETSYRALKMVMEGCGPVFAECADEELRNLVFGSLYHPNRFVRETGYRCLAVLCRISAGDALHAIGPRVAACLQDGLSENWSQVRFAACECARAFLLAAGRHAADYFPAILPHLCFNRHDVAEGVRSYSLETWKVVLQTEGPYQVARCMPQVVSYYVRCAKTNNHTVREAACACMAELAAKIDPDAVRPHLPRIMRTLLRGLRDDSWTVRDAACLATGTVVRRFPEEGRAWLEELWQLWFGLLDDNIFSVRQDAAVALCDAVVAYGREGLDAVLPQLRQMLPRARDQPRDEDRAASPRQAVPPMPSPSGEGDRDLFAPGFFVRAKQDMGGIDYSCGCMDYGFKRPKEPWEASDGAVYLLAGLAEHAPEQAASLLPQLADIARLDHFRRARALQETIWLQLPTIARGLGKKAFKPNLEAFLGPLFASLTCKHQLCRAAAGQCVAFFRDWLGPRIWEGRLDDRQRSLSASSPDVPCGRWPS